MDFFDRFDGGFEGSSRAEGHGSGAPGIRGEQVSECGVGVAVLGDQEGVSVAEQSVGEGRWLAKGAELFQGKAAGGEERTGEETIEALFVLKDLVRAFAQGDRYAKFRTIAGVAEPSVDEG
ncbi:hypothetical protein [Streptomyces sp. NPDC058548]|uniref:hypothetical protein n=1 Tax=unclassified Streptomyces TaxID=2593676 RepID=UPI0036601A9F